MTYRRAFDVTSFNKYADFFITVGSRSTKTALGVWTPVPVSAKKVEKELSSTSMDSLFCKKISLYSCESNDYINV